MADLFEFSQVAEACRSVANDVLQRSLRGAKTPACLEAVDSLNSSILAQLKEISPNFKFIVNTTISENNRTGLHFESNAYWDPSTDGVVTVKFDNADLICICTIYGIAI